MSVLIFYGGLRTYNNNVIGLAVCIFGGRIREVLLLELKLNPKR